MGKIGKISPIKKQYDVDNGHSLGSSLAAKNLTMFPGVSQLKVPHKEKNGDYRTGLDPDALYIKKMEPEEAAQERERVSALREQLESETGLDLGPKSDFYRNTFQSSADDEASAAFVRLYDQQNVFNLSDPMSAITFAWLRVHPEIAPSYAAYERGKSSYRCPEIAQCKFFVDDDEFEAEVAYRQKSTINKAINLFETMSPTRQFKVAKLLGLPISYNSNPGTVYNEIDTYIKEAEKNTRKIQNVSKFMKVANMADENLEIRYKVKEALDFNIYRVGKGGKIYEGEMLIQDSEDELIEFLSSPKNQDDYLALQKKIESAKIIEL